MESLAVDMTYGTALFEAARDRDKIDAILEELGALDKVFEDEPLFFELLTTPSLTAAEKRASARAVFEGKISDELMNFMCVLIDKRRIKQFHGIARQYRRAVNENLGVTAGTVYSAVPLDATQLAKLEAETTKLMRKNVKLDNKTDKDLIAGVRIFVDGKMIDASVRHRLDSLRENLAI